MDGQALWGAASVPLLIALSVLPGALPVFALPCRGLPTWQRALLAAAVTPVVVAIELIALKSLGVPFDVAARSVLALAAAGAAIWVWRARVACAPTIGLGEILAVGAIVAAVATVIWIPWADRGALHYQSAHSVQHAELVYAVMRPGVAPENGLLAGSPVRYPFAAHYFWAWLAWTLDLNPLLLWERTALVALAVATFLFHAVARSAGLGRALGVLAVGLLLCGNSPIDAAHDILVGHRRWEPIKYVLFWQKFTGFTPMWYGLTGLMATLLVCLRMASSNVGGSWFALLVLAVASAGVPYPLAFPMVGGTAAALLLASPPALTAQQARSRARVLIVALAFAGVIAAGAWLFFVGSRQGSTLQAWTLDGTVGKLGVLLVAFGPYLLIALPGLVTDLRRRDPVTGVLAALVALGAGFYVLLPLNAGNEYKGIYFAMPGVALLTARSVGLPGQVSRRAATVAAAGVAIAAVTLGLARNRLNVILGPGFGMRPLVYELGSLELALHPNLPQAGWTNAIRESAPTDTVVVTPPTSVPVSAVTQRAEYVGLWPFPASRSGYGYQPRVWIVEVRGGRAEVLAGRKLQLTNVIYGKEPDERAIAGVLHSFGTLERPVAIFFYPRRSAFLVYLKQNGIGAPLWVGKQGVVWLIGADELP